MIFENHGNKFAYKSSPKRLLAFGLRSMNVKTAVDVGCNNWALLNPSSGHTGHYTSETLQILQSNKSKRVAVISYKCSGK